ncbi:MAG: NAD(+) diphosphatase [Bradymonadia bacterium]
MTYPLEHPDALRPRAEIAQNGGFHRAVERRKDTAWLQHALSASETRVIPTWKGKVLLAGGRAAPRLGHLSGDACAWDKLADSVSLLGVDADGPWIVADLPRDAVPGSIPAIAEAGAFVDLRSAAMQLDGPSGALAAHARALAWFHQRHRYCGVCGAPTLATEAGNARKCSAPECGATVYPRNDPAIIVLVHHTDAAGEVRCFLGRSPRFPPGMFSVLAGFSEAGEGLEAAVRREVHEEVGLDVEDIVYCGSQPWPFPQSLMLGFAARATHEDFTLDQEEIEAGRWFTRDEIRGLLSGDGDPLPEGVLWIPPPVSIARALIDQWLEGALPQPA